LRNGVLYSAADDGVLEQEPDRPGGRLSLWVCEQNMLYVVFPEVIRIVCDQV